jgi:hypothetical protein
MSDTGSRRRLEVALRLMAGRPAEARRRVVELFEDLRHERAALAARLEELVRECRAARQELQRNAGELQDANARTAGILRTLRGGGAPGPRDP